MNLLFRNAIFLLCTASLFTACKKEFTTTPPPSSAGEISPEHSLLPSARASFTRVKTQTIGPYTDYFYYDILGRQVAQVKASGDTITHYAYPDPGRINAFVKGFDSVHYFLNGQGLATLTKTAQFERKTSYNNSGQVTANQYRYANGDEVSYTNVYEAGNMTLVIKKIKNALVGDTTRYTYYTDKDNAMNNEVFGKPYWGSGNKNLLKEWIRKENGMTATTLYTYVFDRLGRVINQKTTKNGVPNMEITYTY